MDCGVFRQLVSGVPVLCLCLCRPVTEVRTSDKAFNQTLLNWKPHSQLLYIATKASHLLQLVNLADTLQNLADACKMCLFTQMLRYLSIISTDCVRECLKWKTNLNIWSIQHLHLWHWRLFCVCQQVSYLATFFSGHRKKYRFHFWNMRNMLVLKNKPKSNHDWFICITLYDLWLRCEMNFHFFSLAYSLGVHSSLKQNPLYLC